jgi:hypothetical protein
LTALPTEVQENVLDAMDRAAERPESLVFRGVSRDAVIDVVASAGSDRVYVFVTVRRDNAARAPRVMTIGHSIRRNA